MNRQIYLDYNATVPVLEKVKNSLISGMNFGPLNASSVHYYGRKSKNLVEKAKLNIARLVNAKSDNIIFTSSVAIYGFTKPNTDELGEPNYFNFSVESIGFMSSSQIMAKSYMSSSKLCFIAFI